MWHPALFPTSARVREKMPARRTTRQGSHLARSRKYEADSSLIGVLVWTVPPLEPFLDHEAERSEERRVGKESRSQRAREREDKNSRKVQSVASKHRIQ